LGGKKNSYYTTLHGKGLEDAFLELLRPPCVRKEVHPV
jgi:hypothetical protein